MKQNFQRIGCLKRKHIIYLYNTMATFFLDQILDEPANTQNKTPHNSKESSGAKTDAAPEITNLDILADNKLFMNKCIYGSGLFDDFIEKQLPIISNLEVFKTTDAELKWKIAAAIKQEFSKPTNKRKSKEQMYEELLKQHESNILVSTRIRIAIENYANSESVRTEIQSMLTTEKTKLVPPEPKYDIIREKLLTLGNRQNCEKGRIRKSRFSEIVGSSKIPPIGLVNLTKTKNNGGSEIKPIQLPTVRLTAPQQSVRLPTYQQQFLMNANKNFSVPPPSYGITNLCLPINNLSSLSNISNSPHQLTPNRVDASPSYAPTSKFPQQAIHFVDKKKKWESSDSDMDVDSDTEPVVTKVNRNVPKDNTFQMPMPPQPPPSLSKD